MIELGEPTSFTAELQVNPRTLAECFELCTPQCRYVQWDGEAGGRKELMFLLLVL